MPEAGILHTHSCPGARSRPARLEGGRLTVEAHRTAAGTGIARKAWRVEIEGERLRVAGRAAA